MADENQEPKKPSSNQFLWIFLGVILLMMLVQTVLNTPVAQVGFSYELEHLNNLQLIQPEESKKTALNNNLVTFTGKFRDKLTEEGKNRYKFIELLNQKGELEHQLSDLKEEIDAQKRKIIESAVFFLQISSVPIPHEGFVVYDDPALGVVGDSKIVITSVPKNNGPTLQSAQESLNQAEKNPSKENIDASFANVESLLTAFRSPQLGIGSEALKEKLKSLDVSLQKEGTPQEKLSAEKETMAALKDIVSTLNQEKNGIRLEDLRAVRAMKPMASSQENLSRQLDETNQQLDRAREQVSSVMWYFNNQELSTKSLEKQDFEVFHPWFLNAKEEWNRFSENKGGYFRAPDQPLNHVLEKTFKSEEPQPNYLGYLITFLPIIILGLFLYLIFSKQMKGVGTNAMNFGKSPAKLLDKSTNKITFKDVAGIEEAKEELEEIVDFLKSPQKFTSLGGRIPKGVLCIGPPGTGKTLIAKAVAGEANRPFFSISGSDFVEMFVGVGASRIRDLFSEAKKNAPCIVFIDEIDAVGRHRGAGIGGGHDEREQTLNQLLVEMDGFDTNEGVILMAATNRPDVLDKALLRPGRFDRRVIINLPDIKGRFDILKVHANKIKMDPTVDLMAIARATPGCSGADLANLLNEAALAAARKNRSAVTMGEMNEARDKVLYGKERRSLELDENEKRTTAFHEAGHTIVGIIVKNGDPIDKVTIIPRGFSLGATMFLPEKNKLNYWRHELYDRLAVMMGGRGAEEIFVGDISSGAQQDIRQATQLARSMVCEWGMSDKLGAVAYDERSDNGQYLGFNNYHEKKYSEETAKEIDAEVKKLVDEAYHLALDIIKKYRSQVELMTEMLIEFETLDQEDIKKIVDGKWDIEEKKSKLKLAADLFKKPTPPPPPPEA